MELEELAEPEARGEDWPETVSESTDPAPAWVDAYEF